MPNTFSGLNMASNALRSFQRALDTTGHNISNVNTAGYSRQEVSFTEADATNFFSGGGMMSLGGGVTISSLSRIRDQFLDVRQRASSSQQGQLESLNTTLSSVQSVFQDATGGGVSDSLNNFFASWTKLAADPSSAANKLGVQTAGQSLADGIRGTYQQLQTLQSQTGSLVTSTIGQIQGLANQIANLNTQIREQSASGGTPNDLLDQRDQALQNLSQLTNVTSSAFPDGTVAVNVSGFDLVDAEGANKFPTASFDPATSTVSDGTQSYVIKGGQLAGSMQAMTDIKGYMGTLDNLANTLRTQVNALHEAGTNAAGNTGVQFFNDVAPPAPQTGAINFDLSAAVKADPNAIVTSVDGTAGDGGIALSLSNLQSAKETSLGNNTFNDFYSNLVTKVGTDANTASSSLDTQNSVATQISAQIASISGVSIDDEMTNMLQFQRSYQAAAKVLTVMDEVTQAVIAMIQ